MLSGRGRLPWWARKLPEAAAAASLSPGATGSIHLWYQMGVGITESSGLVTQWDDQMGTTSHLACASTASMPTQSSGLITFDGVNDYLQTTGVALAKPRTYCALMSQESWATNDRALDPGNTAHLLQQGSTANDVRAYSGTFVGPSNELTLGSSRAIAYGFGAVNALIQVGSTGTAFTGSAGANNATGLAVPAWGGAQAAQITIRELIVYSSTLTSAELTETLEYLESLLPA